MPSPVPRVPQNKYACAMRPDWIAFFSVRATWSCPMTSSNVVERYRRARTVYDISLMGRGELAGHPFYAGRSLADAARRSKLAGRSGR